MKTAFQQWRTKADAPPENVRLALETAISLRLCNVSSGHFRSALLLLLIFFRCKLMLLTDDVSILEPLKAWPGPWLVWSEVMRKYHIWWHHIYVYIHLVKVKTMLFQCGFNGWIAAFHSGHTHLHSKYLAMCGESRWMSENQCSFLGVVLTRLPVWKLSSAYSVSMTCGYTWRWWASMRSILQVDD